jgi:hypothetical protein
MSESSLEAMLQRIDRLERTNRAMKLVAIGAILACIALKAGPALSAFPHGPKMIDAERFNLVTPNGTLVATIGRGPNGGFLAFYDNNGKAEMTVGTSATVGDKTFGVAEFDGNQLLAGKGINRLILAASPTTLGESVYDPKGIARLSNVTGSDGSNAGSFFYDQNGTLRAGIGLGTNGPGTFFQDSNGTARVLEGVTGDDSATSFAMRDINSNLLADISARGDDSSTSMIIFDGNGTQRVTSGVSNASGEVVILENAGGNQTFHAPCSGAACP